MELLKSSDGHTFHDTLAIKDTCTCGRGPSEWSQYWEACQVHSGRPEFSKILVFDGKLKFYHSQILRVIFLQVTGLFFSLEKSTENTQIKITTVRSSV